MKSQQIIRLIVSAVVLFLLSGCAGVSVTGDKSAVVKNPNISQEKGYIGYTPLAEDIYITETELLKYWGNPDEVTYDDNGKKLLLYKRNEYRWNGITLMVIIPIPLLIPVGHDYLSFTVEKDNITSVLMKNNTGESGFYCWIAPLAHPTDWCRAPSTIGDVEDVPLYDFVTSQENLIR